MERDEWDIVYPPIHEEVNRWGETIYVVVLSDQTETIQFVDPGVSREEAHERVRELLRDGLRDGRYQARDFYPPQDDNVVMYAAAADWHAHALEDDDEEAAYGQQHCSGGAPASGEVVAALPEIMSIKDGECSVCLQEFAAGSRLRMMPCAHAFHEHCIFSWLRVGHVCPLCRSPLPTEAEQQNIAG
ncbi:unnamed protein product [Urochloa decumbens]|uniref:RING-type domain-containing protein n=1 Tax=Urochloa decumbens TaxID=240449 RepID=A0ABC8WLZ2_9POAL